MKVFFFSHYYCGGSIHVRVWAAMQRTTVKSTLSPSVVDSVNQTRVVQLTQQAHLPTAPSHLPPIFLFILCVLLNICFICVCGVFACECRHTCNLQKSEKLIGSPEVGITGGCNMLDMGAKN